MPFQVALVTGGMDWLAVAESRYWLWMFTIIAVLCYAFLVVVNFCGFCCCAFNMFTKGAATSHFNDFLPCNLHVFCQNARYFLTFYYVNHAKELISPPRARLGTITTAGTHSGTLWYHSSSSSPSA